MGWAGRSQVSSASGSRLLLQPNERDKRQDSQPFHVSRHRHRELPRSSAQRSGVVKPILLVLLGCDVALPCTRLQAALCDPHFDVMDLAVAFGWGETEKILTVQLVGDSQRRRRGPGRSESPRSRRPCVARPVRVRRQEDRPSVPLGARPDQSPAASAANPDSACRWRRP